MRKFVLSAVAVVSGLIFPSVVAACPPQLQYYRAPVIERQFIRQRVVEVPAPVVREKLVQKQRVVRQRFFVPRANFRSVERVRSNY